MREILKKGMSDSGLLLIMVAILIVIGVAGGMFGSVKDNVGAATLYNYYTTTKILTSATTKVITTMTTTQPSYPTTTNPVCPPDPICSSNEDLICEADAYSTTANPITGKAIQTPPANCKKCSCRSKCVDSSGKNLCRKCESCMQGQNGIWYCELWFGSTACVKPNLPNQDPKTIDDNTQCCFASSNKVCDTSTGECKTDYGICDIPDGSETPDPSKCGSKCATCVDTSSPDDETPSYVCRSKCATTPSLTSPPTEQCCESTSPGAPTGTCVAVSGNGLTGTIDPVTCKAQTCEDLGYVTQPNGQCCPAGESWSGSADDGLCCPSGQACYKRDPDLRCNPNGRFDESSGWPLKKCSAGASDCYSSAC